MYFLHFGFEVVSWRSTLSLDGLWKCFYNEQNSFNFICKWNSSSSNEALTAHLLLSLIELWYLLCSCAGGSLYYLLSIWILVLTMFWKRCCLHLVSFGDWTVIVKCHTISNCTNSCLSTMEWLLYMRECLTVGLKPECLKTKNQYGSRMKTFYFTFIDLVFNKCHFPPALFSH